MELGAEPDPRDLVVGQAEVLGGARGEPRDAGEVVVELGVRSLSTLSSTSVLWRLADERPALCSYMRWSARRSASSTVVASAGTRAMP